MPPAPYRLQAIVILTLEPERLQNRLATTRKDSAGDGRGSSPETLKRLAVLVFLRRSFLLFTNLPVDSMTATTIVA